MNSFKKIILIRNTSPCNFGGGEKYQTLLANELRKSKVQTIILTSSKKLILDSQKQGIPVSAAPYLALQNWSGWRNLLLPFYIVWQVYLYFWYRRFFKKHRPSVINIQSRDDWIAATLAGKSLKIKVFWTDHMDFRSWVFQNIHHPFKNFIGKYLLHLIKYVDKIIAISDFEAEFIKKILPKNHQNKLMIIKNGAIDRFPEFKNIKPKIGQICYLGRLEDYKGIKELIKAYTKIAPKFPSSSLEIYGQGTLANYCSQQASSQIHFHGFTDRPLKVLAESEIFILPSHREGLSLTLLDAVMMSKVIIATNIDGNPEVIDSKTGILIPAKNWQAIADALSKLLNDHRLAKQLSKNARIHYLDKFNFSKIVKEQFLPLLS